ncbi:hypothetical protein DFJ74DRAFT_424610 [Hyaloraphidium curvatum]|nr:hypothetical protein DFJ74DRAFT_424610 [Hyaloraphidium curvatum]
MSSPQKPFFQRSYAPVVFALATAALLWTWTSRPSAGVPGPVFAHADVDALPDVATSHADEIRKKVIFGNFEAAARDAFRLRGMVQFARASFPPGSEVKKHVHADMSETFYCLEGEGFVDAETDTPAGPRTERVRLKPATVVSFNPGAGHRFVNNGTANLVVLYFALRS